MMTLKRFRCLADSFGSSFERWPQEERSQAAALLRASSDAQAVLREAQALDRLLDEVAAAQASCSPQAGEQTAALARLRSGVSARIAMPLPGHRKQMLSPVASGAGVFAGAVGYWPGASRFGWLGFAAGGGIVLFAGFWIGSMQAAMTPVDLLTILQPSLLHGFGV